MTTTAIEVKSLTKSYGKTEVLHGISFTIQQGEIFALLGVNRRGQNNRAGMHGRTAPVRAG